MVRCRCVVEVESAVCSCTAVLCNVPVAIIPARSQHGLVYTFLLSLSISSSWVVTAVWWTPFFMNPNRISWPHCCSIAAVSFYIRYLLRCLFLNSASHNMSILSLPSLPTSSQSVLPFPLPSSALQLCSMPLNSDVTLRRTVCQFCQHAVILFCLVLVCLWITLTVSLAG